MVRAFLPGASAVEVVSDSGEVLGTLDPVHPDGIFAGPVARMVPYRLRVAWEGNGEAEIEDPYRFPPVLGEQDLYLFGEGSHLGLYEKLGAHPMELEGVAGASFAVWAPNARRVSVIGEFNLWDGRRHAMRKHPGIGVWEIFIPGVGEGALQVRDHRPQRRPPAPEGRPLRLPGREAPRHRLRRPRSLALRVGRLGLDGGQGPQERARRPHGYLRGAPRFLEKEPRRLLLHLPPARRRAGLLRRRDGLHPRRVPAADRAPVRRLLGLPATGSLRPDEPVRHARRLQAPDRRLPQGRGRRDHRLGPGALPGRIPTAWLSSTAPTSTSTPTRARAGTPTGGRSSSTTGATRCATTSSPTPCSGSPSTT